MPKATTAQNEFIHAVEAVLANASNKGKVCKMTLSVEVQPAANDEKPHSPYDQIDSLFLHDCYPPR